MTTMTARASTAMAMPAVTTTPMTTDAMTTDPMMTTAVTTNAVMTNAVTTNARLTHVGLTNIESATSTRGATALQSTASPVEPAATLADLPCRQHPADLWFAELPEDVEAAKALCGPCPIREACLAQALDRSEPWGVWGGQLVLQGVVVPRKRPRGRPRKNPVAA